MDFGLSAETPTTSQAQEPELEYEATVASPLIDGQVRLSIGKHAFTITALFEVVEVCFAEVNTIELLEYMVLVETDNGCYTFSKMGHWTQPVYDSLCKAYGNAMLRALFVQSSPLLTARGIADGKAATIGVFDDCVVSLPPNGVAERVPFSFVDGMSRSDYQLELSLGSEEHHLYEKLGYDTTPFAEAVEKQLRACRETSLTLIKELDPSLSVTQASSIARLMPEGVAAPVSELTHIAPSFVETWERNIKELGFEEYYQILKEIGDTSQMYIGFKRSEDWAKRSQNNDFPTEDDNVSSQTVSTAETSDAILSTGSSSPIHREVSGGGLLAAHQTHDTAALPEPYLFWLMVPSPNGRFAAVEFFEANCATFLYRTDAAFGCLARQFNRALEAIAFKREVIRLTDEELHKPENADYFMANKRVASLQFIRSNYAGRVIHSNPLAWKNKLMETWNG